MSSLPLPFIWFQNLFHQSKMPPPEESWSKVGADNSAFPVLTGTICNNKYLKHLREQHRYDLCLYRSAHKDWRNRLLHRILIPVECWSALLFLWILVAVVTKNMMVPRADVGTTTVTEESSTTTTTSLAHASTFATMNFVFVSILRLVPRFATIILGMLSSVIATEVRIGLATLVFHLAVAWSCDTLMERCSCKNNEGAVRGGEEEHRWAALAAFAAWSWTVAWMLQVGLGHSLWEKNRPNVMANMQQVSYLAMSQSVLIAWSS
jgi:uncharacterized membrane protein YGL010W